MHIPLFSPAKVSPRLRRLETLSLFADLSRRELAVVESLMHERQYLEDEIVFDEGDEGQAIYVVLAGKVAIVRQNDPQTPLALLGPGQFFGELALLDDCPRMAQARADEDCTLAVLFRGEFLGLLDTHAVIASKIALQLARELGARLRSVMDAQGRRDAL